MRESINGQPQNNMRRVYVLIDASPCDREAGIECWRYPNCEMSYTSRPGIIFTVLVFCGCNPRRKDQSI
jgi:hypothetical protein